MKSDTKEVLWVFAGCLFLASIMGIVIYSTPATKQAVIYCGSLGRVTMQYTGTLEVSEHCKVLVQEK